MTACVYVCLFKIQNAIDCVLFAISFSKKRSKPSVLSRFFFYCCLLPKRRKKMFSSMREIFKLLNMHFIVTFLEFRFPFLAFSKYNNKKRYWEWTVRGIRIKIVQLEADSFSRYACINSFWLAMFCRRSIEIKISFILWTCPRHPEKISFNFSGSRNYAVIMFCSKLV